MNPADMSACDLRRAYAARTLSPVEALEAVIARVEKLEPRLMALWAVDFEGARAMAAVWRIDERWLLMRNFRAWTS